MISNDLKVQIEDSLREAGYSKVSIQSSQAVSGGSINESYLLVTAGGKYFVKLNYKQKFPQMFEKEKKGLQKLRETNAIKIPEVIDFGEGDEKAFLLLEFIAKGVGNDQFWRDFGHRLAKLHLNTNSHFGLDYDNYIGSLPQPNNQKQNWGEFFIENRLLHQAKMAFDQGLLDQNSIDRLETLYTKLDEIFPHEPPALLHGDLWSGNFLIDQKNQAVLVDPAVYYGHREIDIAMTHLFGGFRAEFYEGYMEEYPMEKGWENRIEICNLYPLLVHVNLFGLSYASRVKSVLKRFR